MKKLQMPAICGVIGGLVGAVIAEFFPKLLDLGLGDAIAAGLTGPFSSARNDLAIRYGLGGLAIGVVLGLIIVIIKKK